MKGARLWRFGLRGTEGDLCPRRMSLRLRTLDRNARHVALSKVWNGSATQEPKVKINLVELKGIEPSTS
jgi:hypothetical protein